MSLAPLRAFLLLRYRAWFSAVFADTPSFSFGIWRECGVEARLGNPQGAELEPFAASNADTATRSRLPIRFRTAVTFSPAISLRDNADTAIIRTAGGGGIETDKGFFVAAPPLRVFRTAPRDPGSVELPASHLGKALTAEGFLDTEGDLHIHGRVFGRVCADRLVLGSGGYLNGDVVARDVHIGGRLTGRIFALNVTLDSSADVTGRIFHHEVTVAKGARIDGRMPWRPPSYFASLKQLPEPRP